MFALAKIAAIFSPGDVDIANDLTRRVELLYDADAAIPDSQVRVPRENVRQEKYSHHICAIIIGLVREFIADRGAMRDERRARQHEQVRANIRESESQ